LFRDDRFIVINKPCDVRMDGDHPVTVETLLRAWVPEFKGAELKWVHQLDYATSGVLCVAWEREAAAAACELFAHRKAKKDYAALVYGHVDWRAVPEVNDLPSTVSTQGPSRKRPRVQFKPASAFFNQHQATIRRRIQAPPADSEPLDGAEAALLSKSWADVKRDPELSRTYIEQSKADEARARAEDRLEAATPSGTDGQISCPTQFRLRGAPAGEFFIDLPVAATAGEFKMSVVPDGKKSRTHVVVEESGTYRGMPATRVVLHPETGRRHQLRVHLASLGHSIVGDVTYAQSDLAAEAADAPRMCLHAHTLELPFEGGHR